jgi:hypothetical protein
LFATGIGPVFGTHGWNRPSAPQSFAEGVSLPGKPPSALKDLIGAWQYNYSLSDAQLEAGTSNLIVVIVLTLREDASYELVYSARWGNGSGGPVANGVGAHESGSFSWSGEVLILEPATTQHSDIENNSVVRQQEIANEKHVLLAHVEKKQLNVAGRCAHYQVDPACRQFPNVWYSMTAQLGRRWLKR